MVRDVRPTRSHKAEHGARSCTVGEFPAESQTRKTSLLNYCAGKTGVIGKITKNIVSTVPKAGMKTKVLLCWYKDHPKLKRQYRIRTMTRPAVNVELLLFARMHEACWEGDNVIQANR